MIFRIRDYKSGQFWDYKSGQLRGLHIGASMDYKSGEVERLHIGAKRLQSGAGITNRGKKITIGV